MGNDNSMSPSKAETGDQPSPNGPLTEDFKGHVHTTLEKWKVPGMSLAVVDGDHTYAAGYGYSSLPDTRASADTLWLGGSTAKAHVGAALAMLIDGKEHAALSAGWATAVSSIIPEDFVLQDEWATAHITLDDIICHRAGQPRHDKASARVANGEKMQPRDITRNLRNLPMSLEPRVSFSYCNTMYVALGHALETVAGKTLDDLCREKIWAPLGMSSTYFKPDVAEKSTRDFATGYYWDKSSGKYCEVPRMDVAELGAAGAIVSTASDYAKWIKCLLEETEPLSSAVHKDIRAPRMIGTTAPMAGMDVSLYALGWVRTIYKGQIVYTHAGGLDSVGAQVFWLPGVRFGAVAFANTAMTSNAACEEVIFRLIDQRLGIPDSERFDFGKKWEFMIEHMSGEVKDAHHKLFPNLPNPPQPSAFTLGDLTGTYSDTGYGAFSLREEAHPDQPGQRILVADRDDMTWCYQLRFHHASGNDWVVYVKSLRNPTFMNEFHPGRFLVGVGGEVSGIEIEWMNRLGGAPDGTTTFHKVKT
ncbi:penicillin-binding protein [Purpureocillium lavendulum]|uniref:Penicillin-binding protein n=1 Tax=Purpureocillium lavendulum TaxID=1247861 RepID=A0AB34FMZ6_9HYPO|nr:penicillin-binding protein [Purpureocillium lavendulum]